MTKAIYIVTAYRWGDREQHSYNLGVFTHKSKAISCADSHAQWRGGKYACVVEVCALNKFDNGGKFENGNHTKEIYRAKSLRD